MKVKVSTSNLSYQERKAHDSYIIALSLLCDLNPKQLINVLKRLQDLHILLKDERISLVNQLVRIR